MPVALPALELVAWLIFAVVLVLALTIKYWLSPIFHVVNLAVGHIPYVGGKVKGGEEAVLASLDGVIATSRGAMTTLLQGVRWSMHALIDGVRDFSDYVADNWKTLVETAIPGALALLYSNLHRQLVSANNRLGNLEGTVADNAKAAAAVASAEAGHALSAAERYADGALSSAEQYARDRVAGVRTVLEGELADLATALTHYAETVAGDVRRAEDVAVAAARATAAAGLETARRDMGGAIGDLAASVAVLERTLQGELTGAAADAASHLAGATAELRGAIAGGIADAESLAAQALGTAEATLEAELSHVATAAGEQLAAAATALQGAVGQVAAAEGAIAAELTAAEHAAAGELADIYNLPADQIRGLLDRLDLTKVLGFGAGLVLVRALVEAIATEAGLEDAACRAKHKQVCGVNPGEWTGLLAGAAFLTGALSLGEILPPARLAFHALRGAIAEAK